LEHQQGVIEPGSRSALTAASQLGGKVTGLLVGGPEQVPRAVDQAKRQVSSFHL
jgi:electron transfer flavoprotein alpha subunit